MKTYCISYYQKKNRKDLAALQQSNEHQNQRPKKLNHDLHKNL